MLRRVLTPLPALAGAVSAVALAVLYIRHGWWLPLTVFGTVGAVLAIASVGGWLLFSRWPYLAAIALEAGPALGWLIAVAVGTALSWLLIKKAPSSNAGPETTAIYAAVSTAIAAFLASVFGNQDQPLWNPVRSQISRKFGESFKARKTDIEKDARDAVQKDNYGANAAAHAGHVVAGWGWTARRRRTRHIQDAL